MHGSFDHSDQIGFVVRVGTRTAIYAGMEEEESRRLLLIGGLLSRFGESKHVHCASLCILHYARGALQYALPNIYVLPEGRVEKR